jgi:uncharacterized membrane protein YjgN (DUF898 family)
MIVRRGSGIWIVREQRNRTARPMTATVDTADTVLPIPVEAAAAEAPSRPSDRVVVAVEGTALFGLLLKTFALSVLTLGIYRFWGRVRVRRMLWSGTTVAGHPLEYTGTGGELFRGFLLVLVVLAPLVGSLQLLLYFFPPDGSAMDLLKFAAPYLLFFPLLYVGVFLARRYLLTRTRWRGVAAGQDGSALAYAGLELAMLALTLLSLGLLKPWCDQRVFRYRMRATRYGTERFEVGEMDTRALWMAWLPVFACILVLVPFNAWEVAEGFREAAWVHRDGRWTATNVPQSAYSALGIIVSALPVIGLVWQWYRVRRFRVFASAVRLGGARVRSDLRARRIVGFTVGAVLLVFLISLVAAAAGGFLMPILFKAAADLGAPVVAAAGMALVALAVFGTVSAAGAAVFWLGLWRRLADSLTIEDAASLDGVLADARTGPRRGEGLADVGGGLAV